jgi:hypothetical protein
MKTILSILMLAFFIPALSQHTRLNGYAGYVFDDKVDSYYDVNNYYNGTIKGGFQWGVGLEYLAGQNNGIEVLYLHQSTTAPTTYIQSGQLGGVKTTNFDVNLDWIMLAGNRYIKSPGSKVEGFGGLMMGAALLDFKNPSNGNSNSATKFAWGFKGGANIWATPKLAIKLQAQLISAVQGAGGSLYYGTGGGGAAVTGYSSMLQFGLGGGICLALGGTSTKSR